MLRRTLYDASRRARRVLATVVVLVEAVVVCTAGAEQPSATVPARFTDSSMSAELESATLGTFEDKRADYRVHTYYF